MSSVVALPVVWLLSKAVRLLVFDHKTCNHSCVQLSVFEAMNYNFENAKSHLKITTSCRMVL